MAEEGNETKPTVDIKPQVKFAGKYETPEAFEEGFRSLDTKMGSGLFKADKPVFGKEGVFADITAAEHAYKVHESLMGKLGAAKPKESEVKPKTEENGKIEIGGNQQTTISAKGIAKVLSKAGLTGKEAELAQTWDAKGELTAEQYAAFEKADVDRELVDAYFGGQKALAVSAKQSRESAIADAKKIAGGDEQFSELLRQAKDFVDPSEIDDFNARLNNPKQIRGAIRDLMALHAESVGASKSKSLITGDSAPPGGSSPVTTMEDFSKVMEAARNGDQAAIKRIEATPMDQFLKFSTT